MSSGSHHLNLIGDDFHGHRMRVHPGQVNRVTTHTIHFQFRDSQANVHVCKWWEERTPTCLRINWPSLISHCSGHLNAQENLSQMKIYEPSSFWFSALGFESLCKEEEEKKMIEDAFPRLPGFFFLRASDSLKCTCLSKQSLWGLGGKNQGGRNNEGPHCLREI